MPAPIAALWTQHAGGTAALACCTDPKVGASIWMNRLPEEVRFSSEFILQKGSVQWQNALHSLKKKFTMK